MEKLKALFRQKEFHMLLFGLCLILFNWPFLSGAYQTDLWITFLALFVVWGIVVFLLFFLSRSYAPSSAEVSGVREETEE